MRLVRVARPSGPAFGVLGEGFVRLLDGHPFAGIELTDQVAPFDQVRLLAPMIPSKVLCVGRNYAAHAAELGNEVPTEPKVFLKPTTTVIGPGDDIVLPQLSTDVQHEAELAVVIGRLTRDVDPSEALDHVLGFTCANDVTARDLVERDGNWGRGKSFDTFCPLGPWIETDLDSGDGLAVRCRVNGEPRQDGNTSDLLFPVPEIIAFFAAFTTLLPGDVVLTGTPEGVGPLADGDEVEVEVEGIGTLANRAAAEPDWAP
ncbi:fumarylacetoacetate hydrolase family protein [soil metagenome]